MSIWSMRRRRVYDPKPGDFDHIVQVDPLGPLIGIKHGDGFDLTAARGSRTAADWLRDAESELGVAVRGYEVLGMLPHGFARHMADTYEAVCAFLQPSLPPLYGAAHSLGCPEEAYLAAARTFSLAACWPISLYSSRPSPALRR